MLYELILLAKRARLAAEKENYSSLVSDPDALVPEQP
jgi:hypothetical protein